MVIPMRISYPVKLLMIGGVLVVLGALLPFLMVLQLIPSTFFLNFFSYAASIAGLFMGFIGVAYYVRETKEKS